VLGGDHCYFLVLDIFFSKIDRGDADEIEANGVYQDTQLTDAFCANLQVVKIDDIGWLPNEMCFIKVVLSKAKVLLAMHLRLGCLSSKSNEDALCELMTYKRASPHAQVFFDGKEPLNFSHLSISCISFEQYRV
jgi:hypothetical protein